MLLALMNREGLFMNNHYLPSAECINFFQRNGWFATDLILPIDIIDKARESALRFYKGDIDFPLQCNEGIANDNASRESAIRNNEFSTKQMEQIKSLGLNERVVEIAGTLLQTKSIRLFSDSLICKKPQLRNSPGNVGWHTDKAYWPTCSSDQLITAWIPMQDVTVEMGPLCILESSHLWEQNQELRSYFGFNKTDLHSFEEYMMVNKLTLKKRMMTLKAGQVSFHHANTIHCSEPNKSDIDRLSLSVHFQGLENNYAPAFDQHGKLIEISYDKLCRKDQSGYPDYSDEEWFPLLWSKV